MIVTVGKQLIHRLLTGEENPITMMGVGSSAVEEEQAQTGLLSYLGMKDISLWTMGLEDVVFETTFNYNEANGTIREVALFAQDGTMFARRVCPDKVKASTAIMKIRYKIHLSDL